MIGNKIVDKITSLDKTKNNEKKDERQEIYTPPEKRQQITDDFLASYKNGIPKTYKLARYKIW